MSINIFFIFGRCFFTEKVCNTPTLKRENKFNSSCEEKENNGIAWFYDDETSEITTPKITEVKNSRMIQGFRTFVDKQSQEKVKQGNKGGSILLEALQRVSAGKIKGGCCDFLMT